MHELARRLDEADIAFAEVNGMAELSRHPHLRRSTSRRREGEIAYPAPAAIFDGEPRRLGAVPELGSHTKAVLREAADGRREGARAAEEGGASARRCLALFGARAVGMKDGKAMADDDTISFLSGAQGLRLRTLVWLRWLAILGQTLAVTVVCLGLGFRMPIVLVLRRDPRLGLAQHRRSRYASR